MAPRQRSLRNRGLPDNLYSIQRVDGRIYFYYINPRTKKQTGFGYDKKESIAAANQLNQLLGKGRELVAKVLAGGETMGEYLVRFRDEILPGKRVKGMPLSTHTVLEYRRIVGKFIEQWGHLRIEHLTQADIAGYLTSQATPEVYNKHRALLVQVYRHLVSDGKVSKNIPQMIIKRDLEEKKRQRLSLEGYQQIYRFARGSIQNAMELSLNSLQRRADIRKMRFDDLKDEEYVYIIQEKTRKHGKSAYLRIPANLPTVHSEAGKKTVGELMLSCRDDVPCPFVIHERPERFRRSKEKEHWAQLSRKQISDGFAEARDVSGFYEELQAEERPSFHELISLGEHLFQKKGWPLDAIQRLRGHTSERMTKHYLAGHEWTTVEVPPASRR